MLGIILRELKKYVEAKLGKPAWRELLQAAGLDGKVYLPLVEYPDSELVGLATNAASKAGVTLGAALEEFGEFIVPDLFQSYRSIINPSWKTLDLIENTEKMIHSAVRLRDLNAKPPALEVVRTGPDSVEVKYRSDRKMCEVAKGIIRGVARQYGERVALAEPDCMHRGATECRIHVTRLD